MDVAQRIDDADRSIRMFVSTKYLSLMELVAGLGGRPLQVETLAEPRERASASLVEGLSFPDDRFEAVRQEGADRPPLFGGHYTRLAKEISVEF